MPCLIETGRALRQRTREIGERLARNDGQQYGSLASQWADARQHLVDELRLHREHDDGRRVRQNRRRADAAFRDARGDRKRRRGIADEDLLGVEAAGEPAFEQRPAHLPRAHKQQRAGEAEGHACPCVSIMAAASASSADLPAHSTNWND